MMAPIIPLLKHSTRIGVTTSRPVFGSNDVESRVGSRVAPGRTNHNPACYAYPMRAKYTRLLGPNEPLREEVNK